MSWTGDDSGLGKTNHFAVTQKNHVSSFAAIALKISKSNLFLFVCARASEVSLPCYALARQAI